MKASLWDLPLKLAYRGTKGWGPARTENTRSCRFTAIGHIHIEASLDGPSYQPRLCRQDRRAETKRDVPGDGVRHEGARSVPKKPSTLNPDGVLRRGSNLFKAVIGAMP